jgi:hypothetical protein
MKARSSVPVTASGTLPIRNTREQKARNPIANLRTALTAFRPRRQSIGPAGTPYIVFAEMSKQLPQYCAVMQRSTSMIEIGAERAWLVGETASA